ncbi:response regulator transcription factor [Brevibacillus invocatus]|uniref:DNA-binding response regulator n=1 Tax=Brevibacillus invocatus TaxID=173959 RepID=A0A3M8C785_9BACL|nr:response regulator transcription factor [Brevibacillus invocatus]MCM3432342.1 response regulator transcription factor [Brevibacillus invocatus]RNB71498.1 DNA-binding response regulator [Brevibacillus invocatus]
MNAIKCLIVENEKIVRESLAILLNMEEDIEVVGTSENGADALAFCERILPDIILMDVHMPVMDGVEATKLIKNRWPQIKVIMLTNHQDVEYVLAALGHGAEGYLLKAISPENLSGGIRLVLQGGTLIPQHVARDILREITDLRKQTEKAGNAYNLSDRELEILTLASKGLNNKEISQKLFLSHGTVKNYISNIYSKMEVRDRKEATSKALDEGIL